jgi:hypothetical protein
MTLRRLQSALGAIAMSLTVASTASAEESARYGIDPGAKMLLISHAASPNQLLQETGSSTGLRAPETFGTKRRFIRGASEVVAVNLIMNAFGRFFMKEGKEGFRVTGESIKDNLQAGMNWDDNTFSANNFRHPYQGGLYFNGGRANGYDFWESSMFSFGGSWLWEYMGEKHNPSFNDFLNTGVGGMILGEITFRLATLITDNTATGSGRAWRELGGFIINPVRGFNRLVTGEASTVHANPADHIPGNWRGDVRFGMRNLGDEHLFDGNEAKVFAAIDGTYGDPFATNEDPFDHFDVGMQLNFNNKPHGIGRIEVQANLIGTEVAHNDRSQHVLAAYQHFDYLDNEAYTFGGQSFGANFISRFAVGRDVVARTTLGVNGILLGATKVDYFDISGREYDYGPGAGVKIVAVLARNGRDIVTLAHDSYAIHSVNGGATNSWDSFTRAKLDVPFRTYFGLGVEYVLYHSERDYPDRPSTSTRSPELRVALAWSIR